MAVPLVRRRNRYRRAHSSRLMGNALCDATPHTTAHINTNTVPVIDLNIVSITSEPTSVVVQTIATLVQSNPRLCELTTDCTGTGRQYGCRNPNRSCSSNFACHAN